MRGQDRRPLGDGVRPACPSPRGDFDHGAPRARRRAAVALEQVGNEFELWDLLISTAYSAVCDGRGEVALEYVERAVPITRAVDDRSMCG